MLERTASSLEQCALHRILHTSSRPAYSRRKLPPTFWMHGAASLEVSAAWVALVRGRGARARQVGQPQRHATRRSVSSGYDALEALYASGTGAISTLRRTSACLVDGHERWPQSLSCLQTRPISTSATSRFLNFPQTTESLASTTVQFDAIPATEEPSICYAKAEPLSGPSSTSTSTSETLKPSPGGLTRLRYLISKGDASGTIEAWSLFKGLSASAQDELRLETLRYTGRHVSSKAEAAQWLSVLAKIPSSSLDNDLLLMAAKASVVLHLKEDALTYFRASLRRRPSLDFFQEMVLVPRGGTSAKSRDTSRAKPNRHASSLLTPETQIGLSALMAEPPAVPDNSWGSGYKAGAEANGTRFGPKQQKRLVNSLDSFLKDLAEMALFQPCESREAMGLLHLLDRPELYAEHIVDAFQRRETMHLPRLFKTYKRYGLATMDPRVPPIMFNIFYPYDTAQLLPLHTYFCRVHYNNDKRTDQDRAALREWWSNYAVRAALNDQAKDPLSYKSYIRVFKHFGDEEMEQFALKDVTEKLGIRPEQMNWYRDLERYYTNKDYKGAMYAWSDLSAGAKPDIHTLATVMKLAADNGDLNYTLQMYEKAKTWRLDRSPHILIPVIRAFGDNGMLQQASRVCTWALENDIRSPELFNTMLSIYAANHRLHESHRLMNTMAQNGIAWDKETFVHLITTLARCKQGDKAYELLTQAMKMHFWRVTSHHFELVMAGAMNTHKYSLVYALGERMKKEGLPVSLNALTLLAKSSHRWAQFAKERPGHPPLPSKLVTGRDLVEHYRKLVAAELQSARDGANLGKAKGGSSSESRVVFTLAEMGEKDLIAEVNGIYQQCPPTECSERDIPDGIITALMIAALERGEHRRVKSLWNALWERNQRLSVAAVDEGNRRAPRARIPPPIRYNLDEGFRTMQQVLTRESDAEGLLTILHELTSAGFKLGRRNWNHTIQALATMGRVKEAFTFCEHMLMPNWMGWRHMRRFKLHRLRRSVSENRPNPSETSAELPDALQLHLGPSAIATTPAAATSTITGAFAPKSRDAITTLAPGSARFYSTAHGPEQPSEDPSAESRSLASAEQRYAADHAAVADFLRFQYNARQKRRWQRRRKERGQSVVLTPRIRQPGLNPRHLRPNAQTLHMLARIYLEMRSADTRSSQDADTSLLLSASCPRTVHAIMTLRYSDDPEVVRWFGDKVEEYSSTTTPAPPRRNDAGVDADADLGDGSLTPAERQRLQRKREKTLRKRRAYVLPPFQERVNGVLAATSALRRSKKAAATRERIANKKFYAAWERREVSSGEPLGSE
ncbi:unnamed protein product [Parascedosporium putredinis]|uniref:Uncharacterized protein n=1 Tax=Parascedosporium putredinis TaxID=1442378 RepID=A0A9P1H510_9PEZI|nr:unnamed protein product [Parascedosporium putredinis]CAI7998785.1 unnamed protein product [Parascedosporium putredinis]